MLKRLLMWTCTSSCSFIPQAQGGHKHDSHHTAPHERVQPHEGVAGQVFTQRDISVDHCIQGRQAEVYEYGAHWLHNHIVSKGEHQHARTQDPRRNKLFRTINNQLFITVESNCTGGNWNSYYSVNFYSMWTVHTVYDCKAYLHAHTAGGCLDFIHAWGTHAPALLWEQEIVSVLGQWHWRKTSGGKQVGENN